MLYVNSMLSFAKINLIVNVLRCRFQDDVVISNRRIVSDKIRMKNCYQRVVFIANVFQFHNVVQH